MLQYIKTKEKNMPDENMVTAYPEKVDEYFRVNEVFIKKIPREIDCIQEIGNSQTRITSAYKYNEYLTTEISFWKENDPRNTMESVVNLTRLKNAKTYFDNAIRYYKSNMLSDGKIALDTSVRYMNEGVLYSKTKLAKFILSFKGKETTFFDSFKYHLSSANRTTTIQNNPASFEGANAAMAYKKVMKDTYERAEQSILEFNSNINQATEDFAKLNKDYLIAFSTQEKRLEEMKNKATEYFNEKEKRCLELEKLYDEKLKLSKPAEYWQTMGKEYEHKGKIWLGWSIAVAVFTIILMLGTVIFVPNLFSEDAHVFDIVKNSAIITIAASVSIYVMRLLVKMAMSSFHLARDAKEREQLVGFYLALINEKAVTDKERSLIINSLFSRSDTGLLKGEATPAMTPNVAEILDKLK